MKKRIFAGLLAVCLCIPLAACGAEKTAEPTAAPETMATGTAEPIDEQVSVSETFVSSDGTAEYTMTIDQAVKSDTLPVVEVVPWDITEEDVERVARAFFPDAVFYERTKRSDSKYTREQLQYKIDLLSELNEEGVKDLYGHVDQDELDFVGRYIGYYTQLLQKAPEGEFREPNQWKFRKEDYHCDYDQGDKVLCNLTMIDGIPYQVLAFARDKGDYAFNRIYVETGDSLGFREKTMLWAKLCRTEEPTQAQIDAAVAKAQQLLDDMEMGQWKVTSWEVRVDKGDEYSGEHAPEYKIEVVAYPVLAGVPALEGQVCYDFQSEEPEASKCMMSSAYFLFSADGIPVYFDMTAPIKEVRVVQEAVPTLSMEELMEKAQVYLGELDPGTGIGIPYNDETFFLMYGETSTSQIAVTSFDYGLARRKVPGVDFHYYYVPTLVFYGSAAYYGADSGELLADSEVYSGGADDILWLDARDGTMIPQE